MAICDIKGGNKTTAEPGLGDQKGNLQAVLKDGRINSKASATDPETNSKAKQWQKNENGCVENGSMGAENAEEETEKIGKTDAQRKNKRSEHYRKKQSQRPPQLGGIFKSG